MGMHNSSNKCNSLSLFLMSPFRQEHIPQCWHSCILVSGSWPKLGLFSYIPQCWHSCILVSGSWPKLGLFSYAL